MKLEQIRWKSDAWNVVKSEIDSNDQVQLVLAFGHPDSLKAPECFRNLKNRYPNANIVGSSTAGNVLNTDISDDDIVATAVLFEKSRVKVISSEIENIGNLRKTVADLVRQMEAPDLKHILVLSDGIFFNGSELAKGVNVMKNIAITGGLAGDQGRFKKTYVMANGPGKPKNLALIGFYGENLEAGYGCFAGWAEFGVDRIITKSDGNIVYEIDEQPALALYKKYLGDFSEELP
ncbi:MAG: FIST N-terminal domain-containing protein, partial [Syntrophales bacterium]|nr:FIST N-terminal domain-containing protein [Syntrophales bacterium]